MSGAERGRGLASRRGEPRQIEEGSRRGQCGARQWQARAEAGNQPRQSQRAKDARKVEDQGATHRGRQVQAQPGQDDGRPAEECVDREDIGGEDSPRGNRVAEQSWRE